MQRIQDLVAQIDECTATLNRPLTEWGSPAWKHDKEQAARTLTRLAQELADTVRHNGLADEYRVPEAPGFDEYDDLDEARSVADRYADRGATVQRRMVTAWATL